MMEVVHKSYPNLFSSINIGGLRLRNRVVMGVYPTQYPQDSQVSDRMVAFYRARARGGVGLIVVEAPSLDYPNDYYGGAQLRLDQESFMPGLRRLTEVIHRGGAKAFLQLNYPAQVGPANARVSLVDADPSELKRIIGKLGAAAVKAKEAGFDGVELQGGWGQLASLLLSPITNKRNDEYGGTVEKRARFLLAAVGTVRNDTGPDFPIQVKLVARDYVPGGIELEDSQAVAVLLEPAGATSILVTAGGIGKTRRWGLPPQAAPKGTLVPLAAAIKSVVNIPVVAIGKIKHPELAESVLENGQADLIGLTRALITDPDWPSKANQGRPDDIRGCISCLQECSGAGVPGLGKACTVNPYTGREGVIKIRKARKSKKVVIVGGGPAGLQTAITATERGHQVHLFEETSRLGGVFAYPTIQEYKGDVAELPKYLAHRTEQLGIKVTLNSPAGVDIIMKEQPDVVVLTPGSLPALPPIPGLDQVHPVEARSIWAGQADAQGKVVVIGGGSVGCETAELLAGRGCQVTVIEARQEVLLDMQALPKTELLDRLAEKGAALVVNAKVTSLQPGSLFYTDADGKENTIPFDTIVLATGGQPNHRLGEELKGRVAEIYYAGDSERPGTGGMAIRAGLAIGMQI